MNSTQAMEMYKRKRIIFAYLVYKKFHLENNRRYWVHPFTDVRLTKGIFYTSFENLRKKPGQIF